MSKVGMGKAASDLQGGQTPTAADSTRSTLSAALGNIVDGMEIPKVEETPSGLPNADTSIYSEGAGFTPEGDLLPLDERAALADQGMMNPEFTDWQDAGTQRYQAEQQASAPIEAMVSTPDRENSVNMMARAEHFSKQIDKASNPDAYTINWHPKSSVRDDYVNLNKKIANSQSLVEKTELLQQREQLVKNQGETENTLSQTINTKLNAVVEDPNTGMTSIDPDFGRVVSMATENSLDNAFMGNKDVDEDMENSMTEDERGNAIAVDKINPADLATQTGRQIHKWWVAEKKANGQPVADTLTDQEAKDLGATGLMSYAGAFPDMLGVDYTKGGRDADGNPNAEGMRFVLKDEGRRSLEANRDTRKRIFDTRTEPSRTAKPAGLTGDSAKEKPAIRGRKNLESDDKAYASLETVEESLSNQNSVNHIVDNRRSRIALALLLPSLYGEIGDPTNVFGDAFGMGSVAYDTIVKEQMTLHNMPEDKANNFAMNVIQSKKKAMAREIQAIAKNMGVPNYLTYAMQPLTGRTMAQQTDFNPTRKKIVRFVTRSMHPAVIRSAAGRLYDNYMNIMALSFGADSFLPKGRMRDLNNNKQKYRDWGISLRDNLETAFPEAMFLQGTEAIREGQQVPDPSQQLLLFQRGLAPDLMEYLTKKGEDAPMAMDALIDFANFWDNMDAGKPHKTHVNAYIDGKTNGIANQAIMLGIRKLAFKVGLLRSDGSETAIEGGDVRDRMAELITARLDEGTIPVIPMNRLQDGKDGILLKVLKKLGADRTINKQISMIFPYGKEITGMKGEIAKLIPEIRSKDKLLDQNMSELEAAGIKTSEIVAAAHDNVVYSLFDIFGEDTFKTRSIMRHVGFLHALTDSLFSIRGPVGHRINMGDRRIDPSTTKTTSVSVKNTAQDQNKNMTMKLNVSDQYLSSASNKPSDLDPRGDVGGHARGQAQVIPTQSYDAAVVLRSSSGKTWDKLKASHPAAEPYFLQIYDAYKVDVHNFDVLSEEVNNNWFDLTTKDYSFLEEAQKELDTLSNSFEARMKADPTREYSLEGDGTFSYLGRIMDPEAKRNTDGKVIYTRKAAKVFAASIFPMDPDGNFMGRTDYKANPKSRKTPAIIMEEYNNFLNDQAGALQTLMTKAINGAGKKNLRVGEIPSSINSMEALAVFEAVTRFSHSKARLGSLVQRTNKNRAALRAETIAQKIRTGFGALQFWAH